MNLNGPIVEQAFIAGTVITIQTMCNITPQCLFPLRHSVLPNKGELCIAGVVDIVSEKQTSTAAICFPKDCYLKVMENFLDTPCTQLDKDLMDGAAEMMNMIFGHAKKVLNLKGLNLQMAIPKVVAGQSSTLKGIDDGTTNIFPFQSDAGDFYLILTDPQIKRSA